MLLGAAYTSTVAGGAVSAILLNIPGAPANIATALDGNMMARKGAGARGLADLLLFLGHRRRPRHPRADIPHPGSGNLGAEIRAVAPVLGRHSRGDDHRHAGFEVRGQGAAGRLPRLVDRHDRLGHHPGRRALYFHRGTGRRRPYHRRPDRPVRDPAGHRDARGRAQRSAEDRPRSPARQYLALCIGDGLQGQGAGDRQHRRCRGRPHSRRRRPDCRPRRLRSIPALFEEQPQIRHRRKRGRGCGRKRQQRDGRPVAGAVAHPFRTWQPDGGGPARRPADPRHFSPARTCSRNTPQSPIPLSTRC